MSKPTWPRPQGPRARRFFFRGRRMKAEATEGPAATKGTATGASVLTTSEALGPLKFETPDDFRTALRQRVEQFFLTTGRKPRDCPQMYVKTTIVLASLAASYALLVFVASAWWMALPLAVLLGLSMAAAGFNIQHDGGHGAYSERRWVNKLMSLIMDLIGGSSYVWARKHNAIHHSYTNVTGHDNDINLGLLGRLSPHQRRIGIHRFQHLYLWFLYGFLPAKWHLYDDFRDVVTGRVGGHRIPRPKGRDLAIFLGGKAGFYTLAFGIPLLVHPLWMVLAFYGIATFIEGVTLSVVFQMAHCVEDAEFPMPSEGTQRMESRWAEHQVETTVDFAPRSRLVSWFVGGLNFQIEHHLFPQICHIHYPAIAPLVEQTCKEFGLKYTAYKSLMAGVASHFRWLRRMGQPDMAC